MTENERKAIDVLKDMIAEGQYNGDVIVARDDEEELKTAIQALEEIQQVKEIISSFPLDCGSTAEDIRKIYRQLRGFLQIGTIEEFKVLKEKNAPLRKIRNGKLKHCPTCKYVVDYGIPEQNYCDRCGQRLKKLDWQ